MPELPPVLVAPSILSADFAALGETLVKLQAAGADWIHLDVMDGRFVPNLTFGPPVIKALRPHTDLFFDAHLMIEAPDAALEAYAEAGCDAVTVHAEACPHLHRVLSRIKELGMKAGVAYNPATPIQGLEYVLDRVDLVLIMTVNPGFGGQRFLHDVLPKIRAVRALVEDRGVVARLSVDGGVDAGTAPLVREAGADVLVAGSAVFKEGGLQQNIRALRESAAASRVER